MKSKLAAAIALSTLALAACGGVNRDGTREKFITDIEMIGGTVDSDCVDEVFTGYSDSEIKALSQGGNDERSVSLATELLSCTDLGS